MPQDAPQLDLERAHGHFAVDCFNRVWKLIEKPDRSPEDDEQMLLLSLSSLWHWTQREDHTGRNLSIGYWQVSRVYALLGDTDSASRNAERCLALAQGSPAFYIAYAHEALARAAITGGDTGAAKRHVEEARKLAKTVSDPKERQLLDTDLASLEERTT